MFRTGEKWQAVRNGPNPTDEIRTVSSVQPKAYNGRGAIIWFRPNGKLLWTEFPRASEIPVGGGRDGYLEWTYDNEVSVMFTRQAG